MCESEVSESGGESVKKDLWEKREKEEGAKGKKCKAIKQK